MQTITKKLLVDRIAEENGMQRTQVKKVLQDFLDHVIDELGEGNRIEFRDFGVFEVKYRAARTAQNPKTLERVPVAAKRSVRFKPGRRMRIEMDKVPAEHVEAVIEAKKTATADAPEVVVERDIVGSIGKPHTESVASR
ncbi:MAG: integration host factor subunit beta [Planctomycetota bacterium]|nr:MAG: integration host factor subunit beta [Planctomycetota bacterium]